MGYLSNLDWTAKSDFSEVFLNNQHIGTYQITEKVEEDDHRVNIGKNGYLIEIEQLEKNVINLLNSNFEKLGSDKRQKDKLKGKEFQIYSQNGEDGLLLYIFSCIGTTNKSIVEIGIGNGTECNSRNPRPKTSARRQC